MTPAAGTPKTTLHGPALAKVALEVETKLDLAIRKKLPDPLPDKAVRRSGVVSAAPVTVEDLDAIYFDTPNLDLLRAKITLRRRTGGRDAGWHLKLPADGATDPGIRTEITVPLTDDEVIPAELMRFVRGAARNQRLQAVGRLENTRTVHSFLDAAGLAVLEIADDQVTATRLGGGDPPRHWREVEVELLAGSTTQLKATVNALIAGGCSPSRSPSKLARALPLPPAPASQNGKTAGAAAMTALARYRDRLINADLAIRTERPGCLHDGRASARRVRSVLRVFAGLFDSDQADSLRSRLQQFAAVLSPARDVEVVRQRLFAALHDEPNHLSERAQALLQEELDVRASAALQAVHTELNSEHYFALLRDLDAFIEQAPLSKRAARPAATELPAHLRKYWIRLGRLADDALADPDNHDGVHEVRKSSKTMRYAVESTIPVLGEEAAVFAASLEEVQDVLGEFQDAQVTAELLADLASDPRADGITGFALGRLHAVEEALASGAVEEFVDAWDNLEDADLADALRADS